MLDSIRVLRCQKVSIFRTIGFVFILLFAATGVVSANNVKVTRELPDQYIPGQQVQVTLNVVVTGSNDGLGIVEYHPYGWQYVSSNYAPAEIEQGDNIYWEFANPNSSYTITYTLLVPPDETGALAFLAEALLVWNAGDDYYFAVSEGDGVIYGPDDGDVKATRSVKEYYESGDEFSVGIYLESYQAPQSVTVEDTFDATYFEPGTIPISHQGQYLGEEGGRGKIRWVLNFYVPPMNLEYGLRAKALGPGPSTFEGFWKLKTGKEGAILGDQQILPYREDQPEPVPEKSCIRTFVADPKIYVPGQPLTVRIDFTTDQNVYGLTMIDRFPKGWTFNSSNPTGVHLGQTITWGPYVAAQGNTTVEYTVTPPEGEYGQKMFVGAHAYKETIVTPVYYYTIGGDDIIGDGKSDAVPAYIPIVRDLPEGYDPGNLIDVTLAYDIHEASPPIELVIYENFPIGWELESADPPYDSTTTRGLKWVISANPVTDGEITYTLRVPPGTINNVIFTGSFTATAGVEAIAGPIIGDSILSCSTCNCPEYFDEGGIDFLIAHYELYQLMKRIRAGIAEPRDLFCFQLQWKTLSGPTPTQAPVEPTPTPTQ